MTETLKDAWLALSDEQRVVLWQLVDVYYCGIVEQWERDVGKRTSQEMFAALR